MLSAPFGSGHRRAAEAVGLALQAEGARVEILDHFEAFVPRAVVAIALPIFWTVLRRAPNLWGLAYEWSAHLPVRSPGMGGMDRVGARGLRAHLLASRPDAVIHVHPTSAGALSWLNGRGATRVPHAIVLTDFAAHPQWIYEGLDRYFVPTDEVRAGLVARGAPAERVVTSGIPIDPAFALPVDRTRCRERLGLPRSGLVVLVVGGAQGELGRVGEVGQALASLPTDFTAVVAAGEPGAEVRLRRLLGGDRRFRVVGRVADMPTVMGAADLVVTKAGALTCAEALALERPLLLVHSLPGQEQANQAAIGEGGAGVVVTRPGDLRGALRDLLEDEGRRAALAEGARRLRRPGAARAVARGLLGLLVSPADRPRGPAGRPRAAMSPG